MYNRWQPRKDNNHDTLEAQQYVQHIMGHKESVNRIQNVKIGYEFDMNGCIQHRAKNITHTT